MLQRLAILLVCFMHAIMPVTGAGYDASRSAPRASCCPNQGTCCCAQSGCECLCGVPPTEDSPPADPALPRLAGRELGLVVIVMPHRITVMPSPENPRGVPPRLHAWRWASEPNEVMLERLCLRTT